MGQRRGFTTKARRTQRGLWPQPKGMKDGVAPGRVKESAKTPTPTGDNAMQSFVSQHQHQIQGTLSGFDRLRFVGSLLRLSYVNGLAGFLAGTGVLLKE